MIDGKVIVNGKVVEEGVTGEKFTLTWEGPPPAKLEVSGDAHVSGNVGEVHAGCDVTCGDVTGRVTAGRDVDSMDIGGGVTAGRDVDAGAIGGLVTAGRVVTRDGPR